ncbi:MAG: tripartite tricarboxylate transporter substrate-binding protein [Proteobacteria bacterium]|nr:tripartite tricarboxylate transporter substrate-binding protein [Pseudomonadota bacterium]
MARGWGPGDVSQQRCKSCDDARRGSLGRSTAMHARFARLITALGLAGIRLTHVPYKGGGQAIIDLVGGQVPIGSLGSTPVIPHHKSGKLKILAQTTAARSTSLSDVPTYEEAGVKGLVLDQWLGMFVPAGTPATVISRLNADVDKALTDATLRERFAKAALDPVGGSQAQFAARFREDYEKFGRLIKELGIQLN